MGLGSHIIDTNIVWMVVLQCMGKMNWGTKTQDRILFLKNVFYGLSCGSVSRVLASNSRWHTPIAQAFRRLRLVYTVSHTV